MVQVQLPKGAKLVEFLASIEPREAVVLQMKNEQLTQALEGLVANKQDLTFVEVEGLQVFAPNEFVIQQGFAVEPVPVLNISR